MANIADVPDINLDALGRICAQAVADTAGVKTVTTSGVCADLIHVVTDDGRNYSVELWDDDNDA